MEAPSESERAYVLDRLADFVTQRATANALVESANLLTQGKLDEIREQIISALETGSRQVEPQAGLEFTNLKERLTKYAAHRKLAATVRSPLDLPVLDELLRGGLEPGTLGFFISPTGRGKTMALVNAGVAAMMLGLNVVHCTLELGQEVMAHRYDARLTGIPINEIAARASKYLRNMIAAAKKVKGSRLIIRAWGSDEASVADIRTYLRVLESSKGIRPQVLLVDYADLLRAYRAAKDRRFELADTVRSLRQLAADYNCAVWTASQTNREGFHSKVLSMHEIAECIEKANIADVLIGLCASREEQRSGRMRLVLLKNRLGGGEGTIVTCRVDAATQLIQQAARQPQYYGE
jgi:replicative DNA helicase